MSRARFNTKTLERSVWLLDCESPIDAPCSMHCARPVSSNATTVHGGTARKAVAHGIHRAHHLLVALQGSLIVAAAGGADAAAYRLP